MANFSSLMDLKSAEAFEILTVDEIDTVLTEQAEILKNEIAKNAISMLNTKGQSTGETARSIKAKSPTASKGGRSITLAFEGRRKRGKGTVSNAEIAFINEFGTKKTVARPFIRNAITATEAARLEILNKHLGK